MSLDALPPSRRGEVDAVLFDLPQPFLIPSLVEWIMPHFGRENPYDGRYLVDVDGIREIERTSRKEIGGQDKFDAASNFKNLLHSDMQFLLDAIWFQIRRTSNQTEAESLDRILKEGGMAWQVIATDSGWDLIKRVEEQATEMMEKAMSPDDTASTHLRLAIVKAFGRQPDASAAYSEAIRAVETVAKPVITPDDPKPSLGKMIAALRDAPHKWVFVLSSRDGPGMAMLLSMMMHLWDSQHGRHGDPDAERTDIKGQEAEAAVLLAVTLVHFFRTKAVSAVEG